MGHMGPGPGRQTLGGDRFLFHKIYFNLKKRQTKFQKLFFPIVQKINKATHRFERTEKGAAQFSFSNLLQYSEIPLH